jgi:hypothetical protein
MHKPFFWGFKSPYPLAYDATERIYVRPFFDLKKWREFLHSLARHPTAGAWVPAMTSRSSTSSVTLPAIPPLVPRYGQEVRQMLTTHRFTAFRRPSAGCA